MRADIAETPRRENKERRLSQAPTQRPAQRLIFFRAVLEIGRCAGCGVRWLGNHRSLLLREDFPQGKAQAGEEFAGEDVVFAFVEDARGGVGVFGEPPLLDGARFGIDEP